VDTIRAVAPSEGEERTVEESVKFTLLRRGRLILVSVALRAHGGNLGLLPF
jgi:hypothetical protein